MTQMQLMHTYSGRRRHRTLYVQTARWSLWVWCHWFARPWLFREPGVCCAGLVCCSFNFYSAKVFV